MHSTKHGQFFYSILVNPGPIYELVAQVLLLCKWGILSNFYFVKKIGLLCKIPSLFCKNAKKCQKVPKKCPNRKSAYYKKFLEFFSAQLSCDNKNDLYYKILSLFSNRILPKIRWLFPPLNVQCYKILFLQLKVHILRYLEAAREKNLRKAKFSSPSAI